MAENLDTINPNYVSTGTPVDGASSYTAHRANKLNPSQSDFTQIATGVTSPYTATGLPAGPVAIGIRAEV